MNPSELGRSFLIQFAVDTFYKQFGRLLPTAWMDIAVIDDNVDFEYAYRVFTMTTANFVELRLYFNLGIDTSMTHWRIENHGLSILGGLGDEVFVSVGVLSKTAITNQSMIFEAWEPTWSILNIILDDDGSPILDDDGTVLLDTPV